MQADPQTFLAGDRSIDFVNTSGAADHLRSYEDLLGWARSGRVIPAPTSKALKAAARANPAAAEKALAAARKLRETLRRLLLARLQGAAPAERDLARFNAALGAGFSHSRIAPKSNGNGYGWSWAGAETSLESPLWPLTRTAAKLLASDRPARMRACAGEGCDRLFLDLSKNRSRRWCDMRGCGNRSKVKRLRARQAQPAG